RATAEILEAVRSRGDAALVDLTRRFDQWTPRSAGELEVPPAMPCEALARLDSREREALEFAASRIRAYHQRQVQQSWRVEDAEGAVLGQQVTPLDRVGLYVPGGKDR